MGKWFLYFLHYVDFAFIYILLRLKSLLYGSMLVYSREFSCVRRLKFKFKKEEP